MDSRYSTLIFILTLFVGMTAVSQNKYEREYRLDVEAVPAKAVNYVNSLPVASKVKWYREESLDGFSVEAKALYRKKKISIEFDETGVLEDVEIKIPFDDIPQITNPGISQFFDENHDKVRIRKVQLQYTGPDEEVRKTLLNGAPTETTSIHYEIVVRAKTKGKWESLEYLFTASGEMVRKSVIVSKNIDHFEY